MIVKLLIAWILFMERKILKLGEIECYQIAFRLSNLVWETVLSWDHFSKNTVGQQFVKSIDSISANIAEGFGRFGKKDKIKFFRYALGSTYESLDWNEKARVCSLIDQQRYEQILHELQKLPKSINTLIKLKNANLKK